MPTLAAVVNPDIKSPPRGCPRGISIRKERIDPITGQITYYNQPVICKSQSCEYCGPRVFSYRTRKVLDGFKSHGMYEAKVPAAELRKIRDYLDGAKYAQIPCSDGVHRMVYTTQPLPRPWRSTYVDQRFREEKVHEAFKECAKTSLQPRISWGSLVYENPSAGEIPPDAYNIFEEGLDNWREWFLKRTGYILQTGETRVPPKRICEWLAIWPTEIWRSNHPEWESLEATEDEWRRLEKWTGPREYRVAA